ncbi:DUF58 domain-containing protein [Venatoribacter cucullus]|uniref:DUF58 domain-containing protein n=1 Tax=Venatoribacter cucullus TaxID=2661630 RepID=UPI00223F9F81|nr:DUF58 domain-containing protein [Venatoribacter cucullus]UZK03289.1 DUF58 domain-containing protein [Venatoribacter cucullus]
MNQPLRQSFSSGADIVAANLVRLRSLAPMLPPNRQKKVLRDMSGSHSSALRGRGMDFAEVRQYQAGDDLRSMDWRVTARTGQAHIKVFNEEKERPVLLVCDLRAGMQFGSRRALKKVLAADLTALLAWAALHNGDRIGALLFNDAQELDLRPKPGRKSVLHLLNELTRLPATSATPQPDRLAQMLRHLRRVARPGSRIYITSDWAGYDHECQQHLFSISRHCDVIALHISDPLEQQLPPPGLYPLTDGQRRLLLDTASVSARQTYQQAFQQQLQQLREQLLQLQIPLLALSTADPDPLPALRAGLGLGAAVSLPEVV